MKSFNPRKQLRNVATCVLLVWVSVCEAHPFAAQLPKELVMEILQWLPLEDAAPAARVSKRWHEGFHALQERYKAAQEQIVQAVGSQDALSVFESNVLRTFLHERKFSIPKQMTYTKQFRLSRRGMGVVFEIHNLNVQVFSRWFSNYTEGELGVVRLLACGSYSQSPPEIGRMQKKLTQMIESCEGGQNQFQKVIVQLLKENFCLKYELAWEANPYEETHLE